MLNHLTNLNSQQQQAVYHQKGPAIVLAGAGSGKTRVLSSRAAWLIQEQNIPADQILLVTFTNKAANEMNERIQRLTGYQPPFSGTFHSLSAKLLRRHGHLINLEPNFSIFDKFDQIDLIKQIYKENHFNKNQFSPIKIKAIISQAKNEILKPKDYQAIAYNQFQKFAAKIYHLYQTELLKQNAVDFDDLLNLCLDLFQKQNQILQQYQQQFLHVLVDEYQDTNKAQYQLTQLLAKPQQNLFVVGDFSQSIYSWRGADYRNLFALKQDFSQTTEYRLEKNYRSTQSILDAASQLIAHNTTHPVLKLWTENQNQEQISLLENYDQNDEAFQISQIIKKAINQQNSKSNDQQIAILYRTNAQSRIFEETFLKNSIPYQIVGGLKFYERKEIKDLLAYLRLLANPLDLVSLERVSKLGKRKLIAFQTWIKDQTVKDFSHTSPSELLKKIIQLTQYQERFEAADPEDFSRLENIQELLDVASQFSNVTQFLENVALIQDGYFHDLTPQSEKQAVIMMSLHSAKGLEFPIVFIVGFEEGLLPHSNSIYSLEEIEEERRLAYVGITRAQKKLYLSWAHHRFHFGNQNNQGKSRFLPEIDPTLLKLELSPQIAQQSWQENYYQTKKPITNFQQKISLIDDDTLEAVLNGEIDIKKFIEK